jgi:AcrR family transcriptional regulator
VRAAGRPPAGEGVGGRESLLIAVCELLQHVSLKELTNARIAERAQVDTTLIRYHFQNRTELMIAVAGRISAEYEGWVEKALVRGDHDAKAELFIRLGYLVDLNVKYPFFRSMVNEEVRGTGLASGKAMLANLTARAERDFGGLIERGVAEGVFAPADPVFVLMSALALSEAVVSLREPRLDPNLFAAAMRGKGPARTRIANYRAYVCELLFKGLSLEVTQSAAAGMAEPARSR